RPASGSPGGSACTPWATTTSSSPRSPKPTKPRSRRSPEAAAACRRGPEPPGGTRARARPVARRAGAAAGHRGTAPRGGRGRRPLYLFAIVVFLVGSLVAGLAGSMAVLIAGRAVQGVGAGGLIGLTFAVVADLAPGRERGRYQGYFGAVFAVASIAGPLLGG